MPKEDTQFKPGQSGNPNGRPPKAWTMSTLIEEALEEVEEQSGKPFKHLVAKRLAKMAVSGDIQAIKEINDRIDGRPKQAIDHTTNGKDLPTPILSTLPIKKDDLERSEEVPQTVGEK